MRESDIDRYNLLALKVITCDDESAYYSLFNSFYSPLCSYAYRYIKDLQTREDCVQDVFLKLWKDRKRLVINKSIHSYLLEATKNHCLNYLHRKGLQMEYEQSFISRYTEEEKDLYSIEELEDLLAKAIRKLPEKYRQAFLMNRNEGYTYKVIAEELNISVKTVESYMSKSLSFLRKELQDYQLFFPLLFLVRI